MADDEAWVSTDRAAATPVLVPSAPEPYDDEAETAPSAEWAALPQDRGELAPGWIQETARTEAFNG